MRKCIRLIIGSLLLISALSSSGCSEETGVGISVAVPVGNNDSGSVSADRWY